MSALQELNRIKEEFSGVNKDYEGLAAEKSGIEGTVQNLSKRLSQDSGALRSLQGRRAEIERGIPNTEVSARQDYEGVRVNPLLREAMVGQRLAAERARVSDINDFIEREGMGRQQLVSDARGLLDSQVASRGAELDLRRQSLADALQFADREYQMEQDRIANARSGAAAGPTWQEQMAFFEQMTGGQEQGAVDDFSDLDALTSEVFGQDLLSLGPVAQSNVTPPTDLRNYKYGPDSTTAIGTRNGNMVYTKNGWVDRNSLRR